ncbi:hypothetical protein P691DRAFT_767774 [Macrolepiota fuliginosa MF-IS2]|uniref:Uncharacterized protein n=1 Tax=Macrolepiota fuliginosa MF-IS2 TaxID=1400762 RepID=A0A9P5WYT5_9AGAR|nr:hypothetical protein P691DRAFT_767774 [Macrolepiota fuliginosa MF-IS2]
MPGPMPSTSMPTSVLSAAQLVFHPNVTMQHFLATMNQNHCIASQFLTEELEQLYPKEGVHFQIFADLTKMGFTPVKPNLNPSAPIEVDNNNEDISDFDELSPAEELTNAIAAFRQWFKNNNIADNVCPSLIENTRHLAMMFSLIPVPHHCPIPPPCTHPHQDDTLPCCHLHANDVPPPPPCSHSHHNDEDIPMEPTTPACAFSEAASQTPAPSHEATMPPPPPAAVATSPAAVASSPSASPCG